MSKSDRTKDILTRRKFLKGGAMLAVAAGLTGFTGKKTSDDVVKAIGVKELDEFPYEVAPDFKRYDNKNTTFIRDIMRDPEMLAQLSNPDEFLGITPKVDENFSSQEVLNCALIEGAKSIDRDFTNLSGAGNPNSTMYTWNKKASEIQWEYTSEKQASKVIKKAGNFYGADLIGITKYDERWVYDPIFQFKSPDGKPKELSSEKDFPFQPKSVIVMAVEMDYECYASSPSTLAGAATNLGYSTMAEVTYKMADFIRHLGYNAFGTGNDVAENIPYAIAAGLGEQGRQGLLITYEYGPRVRICKVFTDMELAYDKPIRFGANDFCTVCKKCAVNCPSQSISHADDMTWKGDTDTRSNHIGVKKYYVNVETCHVYLTECKNGCNVCVATCPYNKPDFWHHKITTALTSTPLKPFLNEMDDIFGYGNVFDEKAVSNFWDFD